MCVVVENSMCDVISVVICVMLLNNSRVSLSNSLRGVNEDDVRTGRVSPAGA